MQRFVQSIFTETGDYTSLSIELTFTPSATRIIVGIPITDDNVIEAKESFSASLTGFRSSGPSVTLGPTEALIEITDNDCKC